MHQHVMKAVRERVALNAIMVNPPPAARRAASEALAVRKTLPKSKCGGLTPAEAGRQDIGSGVKRAVDIAAGRKVDAGQVHRFCTRFAGKERVAEARGLTLAESRMRQAWDLWGGSAMCREAARAIGKP